MFFKRCLLNFVDYNLLWNLPIHIRFEGLHLISVPQWGTAKIKVPSVENPELKGSPIKTCSRSVHSYASLMSTFPVLSASFFFFQTLSRLFSVLAVTSAGSCGAPQNKIGHPAGRHNCLLVSRCFEPCQPQRTASGIETKFSLFPSYS